MPFIPHTDADVAAMLQAIGVGSIEQLFDEIPDTWVIIGALIIVSAISYLTHREAMVARRIKLQAAEASSPG